MHIKLLSKKLRYVAISLRMFIYENTPTIKKNKKIKKINLIRFDHMTSSFTSNK